MKDDSPSRTAELVCFMRAADERDDPSTRVVGDPYAHFFLTPMAKAALKASRLASAVNRWAGALSPGVTTFVLARHRFIDDALTSSVRDRGLGQIVLLGAGYDTRAHRLATRLGGARVFEVDHPATGARKRQIMAEVEAELPTSAVTYVEVDFRTDSVEEKLDAAGFDRSQPAFFVWEGVSMYLQRAEVKTTLDTLGRLGASGSELAMDFWFLLDNPNLYSTIHRAGAHALHFLGEPITFSIHPEDVGAFLRQRGWSLEDLAEADELEKRFISDARRASPANYVVHAKKLSPG